MNTLLRHTLYWLAAGLVLAVGFLYYRFNPAEVSFFPACLLRKYTGLYCPGCGAQRALHQLLHGHIREAFRYNALLVLAIPYVTLGFVLDIARHLQWTTLHPAMYRKQSVILGIAVLICLFWIFRNIPMEPFSWLAPQGGGD